PHPGTLEPARRAGVPLRIRSSRDPEAQGTRIGPRRTGPATFCSIACRPNDRLLFVLPAGNRADDGFVPRVLDAAEPYRPALLPVRAEGGEVHLALHQADRLEEVRTALTAVGAVLVVEGRAAISLVSEDLADHPDLAGKGFAACAGLDPRLIPAGAGCGAIRCLVEGEDLLAAVTALHTRLAAGGILGDER
ncbi:MAG: hypothetical protein M3O15_09850, partial [Acidobacteriota bacterium]|nr:hypothetical protein [Acidobacteriota bacterium]